MEYDRLAAPDAVEAATEALNRRGISAISVPNRKGALQRMGELIPDGASVMAGASKTLEEIGFLELLGSNQRRWVNLRELMTAERDPARLAELRQRASFCDFFVGSVHAVSRRGEVIVASATGSQLAAYVFTGRSIIWVVGTQKVVDTIDDGLRRIREYCLPLEDQRMKQGGREGSFIGKILILEKERPSRKVHLIFVNERLGF